MAEVKFDYTTEATIEIKNVIDPTSCKYAACDAGTPVQTIEMLYDDVKDKTCVKFDYLYNRDGSFKTNDEGKYVVAVHQKFKNTERLIPAYRVANEKVLKVGESMTFKTSKKDEVVFYEKFAEKFVGELEVKINGKIYPPVATAAVENTETVG